MSSYKLHYFNFRGRGEAIRWLLSFGGIEFEDIRFEEAEWPPLKSAYPYGKVPVLEIDGVKYSSTIAICDFLGRKLNLAGSSDLETQQILAAATFAYDLIDTVEDVLYYYKPSFTEEVFKEEFRKLTEETIPASLKQFEKIAAQNGGFLVNGKLSWADIYLISIIEYIYGFFIYLDIDFKTNLLENLPNLSKLDSTVRNVEAIKSWIAKRPETKG